MLEPITNPSAEAVGAALSKLDGARRSTEDVRKFSITFSCGLVRHKVQFEWTEAEAPADAELPQPKLKRLSCSGSCESGCPVELDKPGLSGWKKCPRIQKLTLRLAGNLSGC